VLLIRRSSDWGETLAAWIGPSLKALDEHPKRMGQRRKPVEHPFGTIRLHGAADENAAAGCTGMAIHVLACNFTS
jgi:hypothetical protein